MMCLSAEQSFAVAVTIDRDQWNYTAAFYKLAHRFQMPMPFHQVEKKGTYFNEKENENKPLIFDHNALKHKVFRFELTEGLILKVLPTILTEAHPAQSSF